MLVLCLGLSFGMAVAQKDGKGGPDPEKQTKRLTKELGLSSDQAVSIGAIFTDTKAKVEKVRSTTQKGSAERKNQLKTIHDAEDASVAKVLTPDQVAKYEKIKVARREREKSRLKEKLDELED